MLVDFIHTAPLITIYLIFLRLLQAWLRDTELGKALAFLG